MTSTKPICVDGAAKAVATPAFIDIENAAEDINDVIDVENESMKTPSPKRQKTQLQKVFDLSKDSAEATYHWMRCVFTALHSINILLYIDLFCLFAFSHVFFVAS